MRVTHRYITWGSHLKVITPIRAILDKYNISYKYKEDLTSVIPSFKFQIEFYLYEDNPCFKKLKPEIDVFNIEPQKYTIYEKSDIENAEWFIVSTGNYQYPQPEENFEYLKYTFNLSNYCQLCDIGKIQKAPFRFKTEPKQYSNQFWGLHWEYSPIFVRQETKNIFENEGLKGIRFSNPVLHKKNTTIENFYQLHIDTILEKGFDSYNTKTITCKPKNEENLNTDLHVTCCGSIKYHHPKVGGYFFDSAIFKPEFEIVESGEYFGSGGNASKLKIISRRLKKLIEKNRLKGLVFTPIMQQRFIQ